MTNRARGEGEEGSWGRLKIEMRDGERQNGGVLYNPPQLRMEQSTGETPELKTG